MFPLLLLLAAADPSDRAAALVAEASDAFAAGAFERAAERYLEARRILENTEVTGKSELLYNAGLAYERAGRCDRAADLYQRFADESPNAKSSKAFRTRFEGALRCAPEIVLDTVPKGAEVWIDGEVRGSTPLALRLAKGHHAVELRLDGHQPASFGLDVEAGTKQRVERALAAIERAPGEAKLEVLPPAPSIAPPPPEIAATVEPREGMSVAPWIVAGAGVLAIGAGVALQVLSNGAKQDAEEALRDRSLSDAEVSSKEGDSKTLAYGGVAAFATGGAALATAGVLWILEAASP